jgi:putative ABC transport system permease protein
MNYLQNHALGFRASQTMVINFEGDDHVQQRIETIKQQLLQVPGVKNISASSNVPGDGNVGSWSMDFVKKTGDTIHTELPVYCIDFNYLHQYEVPLVAGRSLSNDFAEDSTTSMLINETALKQLGFASANDAIGVKVGMYPSDAKIVGVVKDFHYESLQKALGPLAIRMIPFKLRLFSVQLNSGNIQQTVAAIGSAWKDLAPERPLEYSFLDESFNRQYQSEIKFGQVFGIFTSIAIVIACLGLFGLALFSIQQRIKEIGVRKVLGASVAGITYTLSKDFIKLVLISILIASPIAYYFMAQWLQGFAYRVSIGVWVFLVAALGAIFIALLTISFQAVKAALANPAKSLRTE